MSQTEKRKSYLSEEFHSIMLSRKQRQHLATSTFIKEQSQSSSEFRNLMSERLKYPEDPSKDIKEGGEKDEVMEMEKVKKQNSVDFAFIMKERLRKTDNVEIIEV